MTQDCSDESECRHWQIHPFTFQAILRFSVLDFSCNVKDISSMFTNDLPCQEIKRAEDVMMRIIQSKLPSEFRKRYSRSIQIFEENEILNAQSKSFSVKNRKTLEENVSKISINITETTKFVRGDSNNIIDILKCKPLLTRHLVKVFLNLDKLVRIS